MERVDRLAGAPGTNTSGLAGGEGIDRVRDLRPGLAVVAIRSGSGSRPFAALPLIEARRHRLDIRGGDQALLLPADRNALSGRAPRLGRHGSMRGPRRAPARARPRGVDPGRRRRPPPQVAGCTAGRPASRPAKIRLIAARTVAAARQAQSPPSW